MEKYERYLYSDQWKEKRKQRLEIDNNQCVICGSTGSRGSPLEVHHLTYRHIYQEDIYTDLVTLCPECHEKVHKMMNRVTDRGGRRGWRDSLSYSGVHAKVKELGRLTGQVDT